MSIIKLDQQRSYNEEKYVCFKDFYKLYYYQINDSDELCCCINYLNDIKKVKEIGEKISVNPSSKEDDQATIDGDFRVTTMLININCNSNEFKFASYEDIYLPPFIKRVYFSEEYVTFSQKPYLKIDDDNRNICQIRDKIFEYRQWYYSHNGKELFYYFVDDSDKTIQDIVLPDGLETIHKFAFMYAKHVGTLRIPASVKEIGKGAFFKAKINKIIYEGKWTKDIDAEAFSGLEDTEIILVNDTAQDLCSHADFHKTDDFRCGTLSLLAPSLSNEDSPAIGYIRVTQSYYFHNHNVWNNNLHKEGIIDINTRYIVSVQEYNIPTYTPVKGTMITIDGSDNEYQHYCVVVYEPVAVVLEKIDTSVKQLNATGCTVDELIDRINSKIK